MKLALVCPYNYFRHGGVQTHVRDMAVTLRKQGHQVDVLAPGADISHDEEDCYLFGRFWGFHFDRTENDISWALGSESRRLKRFLDQQHYDLIHFHTPWDPFLSWQILAMTRCATVATFHNTLGRGLSGRFLNWMFRLFGPWFLGKFDALTAVSQGPLEHMRPPAGREIIILPPSIDLSPLLNQPRSIIDGKQVTELLFIGRMDARKGVQILLEAFQLLIDGGVTVNLTLAGGGGELEKVRAWVAEKGISQIKVLGPVSEQRKRELLAQSEIFCSPAFEGESFGLVLMEALAAGCAVIASANPGYAALMQEQAQHCLVKPGDTGALAAGIKQLVDNPTTRQAIGDWGRTLAKTYDCSSQSSHFEECYQTALTHHQDRRQD